MALSVLLQLFLFFGILPPYSRNRRTRFIIHSITFAAVTTVSSMTFEFINCTSLDLSVVKVVLILFLSFLRSCVIVNHVHAIFKNWNIITKIVWPALMHIRIQFSILALPGAGVICSIFASAYDLSDSKFSLWRAVAMLVQRFMCYLIVIEFCACLDFFRREMGKTTQNLNENCNIEEILMRQNENVHKVRRVNRMFGPQLSASFMAMFVCVLVDLYAIFTTPRLSFKDALELSLNVFIPLHLGLLMATLCSILMKKNEHFSQKLFEIAMKSDRFANHSKVHLYLAFKDPLEITANKYLTIRIGHFAKVVAAAYTFLTILVQFSSSFNLEQNMKLNPQLKLSVPKEQIY